MYVCGYVHFVELVLYTLLSFVYKDRTCSQMIIRRHEAAMCAAGQARCVAILNSIRVAMGLGFRVP